ncbi:MAG: DHA2 family efflux MFS transporter permease subunit, partial [Proteobacteria bacterium]|nr:DHA2 family efflux MFS transporter permease subunit [Pseudomonadota bacterium]
MAPAENTVNRGAEHPYLISASVVLASLLYSIDWTIAVVALPHMQGAFSATQDQISWVITSYIVASAIMMPMAGYLTNRFGRKRVYVLAVTGFILSSIFCGTVSTLTFEVIARIAQGMSGAFLVPVSLAIMLDVFPEKDHPKAMAIWGMGWAGSFIGPILGGALTEYFSWRYIFFINVPLGIAALIGCLLFLPTDIPRKIKDQLDWFGFLTLAIGIASLQMMLDRGQRLDWFESGEIIFEGCLALIAIYMFNAHVMTKRNPFLDPKLLLERNFFLALILVAFYGLLTVPPMVLLPTFLEELIGYEIVDVGILQSSRGIGVLLAMVLSTRISGIINVRVQIAFGLSCLGISSLTIAFWTSDVGVWPILWTGFVSGIGSGVMMVPAQIVAFSRVAAAHRTEGAAVFNLVRTIFSSVGISLILAIFIYTGATGRSELVEH